MPHGFICGFPVQSRSSELWGYIVTGRSGPQAEAIRKAALLWGGHRNSELGIPVCKTGYRPFNKVSGKRMYGCTEHSHVRQGRIEAHGGYLRPGWESFLQWGGAAAPECSDGAADPATDCSVADASVGGADTRDCCAGVQSCCDLSVLGGCSALAEAESVAADDAAGGVDSEPLAPPACGRGDAHAHAAAARPQSASGSTAAGAAARARDAGAAAAGAAAAAAAAVS